jgi:hypothetical protein
VDDFDHILASLGFHMPHFDVEHDVRTGANSSPGGGTVDIDRHVPARTREGWPIRDLWALHELVEGREMDAGMRYPGAHVAATKAEKEAANALNVPWRRYEETSDGYLSHIEHEKAARPPQGPLHVSARTALGRPR